MTYERDTYSDVPRYPIDDATAERLLTGGLAPEDAPPGYADVAGLIQAATRPASRSELAREATVVTAGVAALVAATSAPTSESIIPRRQSMLARLLSAKVAAVGLVAVLGAGTAAAALTDTLPTQTHGHATSHGNRAVAKGEAKADARTPTPAVVTAPATGSSAPGSGAGPTNGMKNGHATFGLCTAFLAGNGSSTKSGKDSSTAFKVLIAAHGGTVASTTSYCKGVTHPGKPSSTAKPSHNGNPSSSGGKPPTTGKPPSTGKSAGHAAVTTPNSSNHRSH